MDIKNNEYEEMYAKLQSGEITEQEWKDYCLEVLKKIIGDNKDIFSAP